MLTANLSLSLSLMSHIVALCHYDCLILQLCLFLVFQMLLKCTREIDQQIVAHFIFICQSACLVVN